MLYKIYYELDNGTSDFFAIFSNNIEEDKELIEHQVKLREGKFLYYENTHIKIV